MDQGPTKEGVSVMPPLWQVLALIAMGYVVSGYAMLWTLRHLDP